MPDFLLEIGCEEIPARMIDGARQELSKRVSDLLKRERLLSADGTAALGSNAIGFSDFFSKPQKAKCFASYLSEYKIPKLKVAAAKETPDILNRYNLCSR